MLTYLRTWLTSKGWLTAKEEGASLVEYALLVGLISIVSIVVMTTLGTEIKAVFNTVLTAIQGRVVAPSG